MLNEGLSPCKSRLKILKIQVYIVGIKRLYLFGFDINEGKFRGVRKIISKATILYFIYLFKKSIPMCNGSKKVDKHTI